MPYRHFLNTTTDSPYAPEILAQKATGSQRDQWYQRLHVAAALHGVTWIPATGYVYTPGNASSQCLDAFLDELLRRHPVNNRDRVLTALPDEIVRAVTRQ
jgi:hypothetical protein